MRRATLWLTALLGLSLWTGCLHPAQSRVERDLLVGQALGPEVEVRVDDGRAAVRKLTTAQDGATEVELWAGAPTLTVKLTNKTPDHRHVRVLVRNALPDAEATSQAPSGGLEALVVQPGSFPTERKFELELNAQDTWTIQVAPRDADAPGPWRFGVLSDVQEAIDQVQDLYSRINLDPQIRFVIGVGDLTSSGNEEQLLKFQEKLQGLKVPYYATVGNHDIGTPSLPWYDLFGKATQHFVYRGVSMTLMDDASATVDPAHHEALDTWLTQDSNLLKIVAMHIPILDPVGTRNGSFASRDEAGVLLSKLARREVNLLLHGHIHSFYAYANGGIPAFISGGGGAIPERLDNIGRHFLTVDVDPAAKQARVSMVQVDRP